MPVQLADLHLGTRGGVLHGMRQRAMFPRRIGERVPLVMTPTWLRPTWTQCSRSTTQVVLLCRGLQRFRAELMRAHDASLLPWG